MLNFARWHGVSAKSLHSWRKRHGDNATGSETNQTLEGELKRLKADREFHS